MYVRHVYASPVLTAMYCTAGHVYQAPLRYLYHTAAVEVKCGEDVLYVPVYMAFTAEQLVQLSKLNTIPRLPSNLTEYTPRTQERTQ